MIGEIEMYHPKCLGFQDTYYVRIIKVRNRIYQQKFFENYSRDAFARLYDQKQAFLVADRLNDRVVSWLNEQLVTLLRVLADRGSEYCGNREHHEYQLYLASQTIDRTRTQASRPQINRICQRFHRTMQEEFYSITFCKNGYATLEELQRDVDEWIHDYNWEKSYKGRKCSDKTLCQSLQDSKTLALEKQLDTQYQKDIEIKNLLNLSEGSKLKMSIEQIDNQNEF